MDGCTSIAYQYRCTVAWAILKNPFWVNDLSNQYDSWKRQWTGNKNQFFMAVVLKLYGGFRCKTEIPAFWLCHLCKIDWFSSRQLLMWFRKQGRNTRLPCYLLTVFSQKNTSFPLQPQPQRARQSVSFCFTAVASPAQRRTLEIPCAVPFFSLPNKVTSA